MKYKIYLDDMRPLPEGYDKLAHSVFGAEKYLCIAEQNGYTDFVLDLDHDLGDYFQYGGDGIEFIKWLIETGRNTTNYEVKLHTMNPVGKINMQALIDRYWR